MLLENHKDYIKVYLWIDVDTLDTLDNQQYSAGLAEVIKYGLLGNADFFTHPRQLKCKNDQNAPLITL
jgi:3-dehydroquinate synthase